MTKECLKCGFVTDIEPVPISCPSCGAIYFKVELLVSQGKIRSKPQILLEHEQEMSRLEEKLAKLQNLIRVGWQTGDWSAIPKEIVEKEKQKIIITTTESIPGKNIIRVLEIISSECVYGMNVLKDILAGITDVAGGRSKSTQKVLRDAKQIALKELRHEAFSIGAEAVIGVRFNYNEVSGGGKSMLFIVATGTAVKIDD